MNKSEKKKPGYPTFREYRRKEFLNIATAVGVGVTAAVLPFSGKTEEKPVIDSKKLEDQSQKLKDQIILLSANLGHKDYKERQKATTVLISMGHKFQKEKNTEMTKFLKSELEKSKKSKDPEVRKRANNILLAITVKPVKRHDQPVLMGARAPR